MFLFSKYTKLCIAVVLFLTLVVYKVLKSWTLSLYKECLADPSIYVFFMNPGGLLSGDVWNKTVKYLSQFRNLNIIIELSSSAYHFKIYN